MTGGVPSGEAFSARAPKAPQQTPIRELTRHIIAMIKENVKIPITN
jgi:hypothetical protein